MVRGCQELRGEVSPGSGTESEMSGLLADDAAVPRRASAGSGTVPYFEVLRSADTFKVTEYT